MDWVLDSVENYRLAGVYTHVPTGISVTQMSQAKYDLPDEMLQ
jgi:hypothetical protein